MGYYKKAVSGISWMGGLRAVTRVAALGRTAILARILLPSQFGVYGIAALVLALLEILTETGINVFLIQENRKINDFVNTAWIISIFRGAIIGLVIFLSAPLAAQFFRTPEALSLLRLVSLVPLIKGFINPSIVKFQKLLKFKNEFWFRLLIFLFDSSAAITLAWFTKSPSSLVWGLIAGSTAEVVLSFLFLKPTPRFKFNKNKFVKIINRGKWVTMAGIFNYLSTSGADVIIARILNTASLGLFQMSYKLATLPITEIGNITGKVTFPVFVQISGDRQRLHRAWIKSTLAIAAASLPISAVILIFPRQLIGIFLGNQWLSAAPVLQILAVYAFVRALSGASGAVFFSIKRQDIVTKITLFRFVGLALSIVPLTNRYGINGAAMSALISTLITLPLIIYYISHVFKEPIEI